MRQAELCQYVHCPLYQASEGEGEVGFGVEVMCVERKASKGAVKTAATSFASRRGIRTSSALGRLPGAFTSRACVAILLVTRPVAAATAAVRLSDVTGECPVVLAGMSDVSASSHATHGRTPSCVAARFMGNWQRWWIRKGVGKEVSVTGRPISS